MKINDNISSPIVVQGACFYRRSGFDDCSVAVADKAKDYCRTEMHTTVSC